MPVEMDRARDMATGLPCGSLGFLKEFRIDDDAR